MDKVAIKCKNICKAYGERDNRIEALKGINLEVESGKLTLLVGPSGSGKTTLLSIITTILTPDSGELYLLGQDIKKMNRQQKSDFCRNNIGIVFQSLFLIPTLNITENISLPLVINGHSQEEANQKSLELLQKMHLDHRWNSSPFNLSKGQQQRVAIARAIVNNSTIIACDEPTSALDQESGLEIMTLLKELSTNMSKAVLVVTHDQRTFPFADRIVYMNDGQIEVRS